MRVVVFFVLLSVAGLYTAHAQRIQGKVTSAAYGTDIPFASIQVVGTTQGTVTNENGEFNLTLSKLPAQPRIGSIGHESVMAEVARASQLLSIQLKEGVVLVELIVMPDSSLRQLLWRAYARIPQNYPTQPLGYHIFYRESLRTPENRYVFERGSAPTKSICT